MTERLVQFGEDGRLVGNINMPSAAAADHAFGLILLNAGIVPRVGPHRINVKLARRAAALGVPSIRFDLSGRGDSRQGLRHLDYRQQAISDIRAALQALEDHCGTRRYLLFGICSGADDALATALVEPRIAAASLFDPYIYPTLRWRLRIAFGKLRKFGVLGGLRRLKAVRRAKRSYENAVLNNFGRDVPPLSAYAADLATLAARGVALQLLYSGSSVDLADYRAQVRKVLGAAGLHPRIVTAFLPDVDHVVTSLAAQEQLLGLLESWIRGITSSDRNPAGIQPPDMSETSSAFPTRPGGTLAATHGSA